MENLETLIANISNWADEKGLLKPENAPKQLCKTMEELGETASALLKGDREKLIDGIADTIITLVIFAGQNGLSLHACLEVGWEEIKNRKGKTTDGIFIKEV